MLTVDFLYLSRMIPDVISPATPPEVQKSKLTAHELHKTLLKMLSKYKGDVDEQLHKMLIEYAYRGSDVSYSSRNESARR